ncbi:TetR family transcriptional regulator [bacterium]|nr:TetR family transcriptional regulator [bacterium]
MTDDLKTSILQASVQLIEDGGVGALSMREVARRAGVSHQAPYHYFPDRESILSEIVREGFTLLHDMTAEKVARVESPAAMIEAMGLAYVEFALRHSAYFQLMFRSELVNLNRHPETKAAADRTFELVIDIVTRAYGAAEPGAPRASAEDGEDPVIRRVIACWSMVHGLSHLLLEGKLDRHHGGSPEARLDAARALVSVYVEMIAPGLPQR